VLSFFNIFELFFVLFVYVDDVGLDLFCFGVC